MNNKEILLECLGECKETYIGYGLSDGYRCPNCNGYVAEIGFIKEIEKETYNALDKINRAKENGSIRKYRKKSSLGYIIKKLRKERNITQIQLGDAIDKTESTIRKYEANIIEPPLSVINNIAKTLDITLNELIKQIDLDTINTKYNNEGENIYAREIKRNTR